MSPMELLLRTSREVSPLILRLTLAVVMFPHAAQKAFGWFGGSGFSGSMHYFTHAMHVPGPLAFIAIVTELVGSLGLALGLLTRLSALGMGFLMVVATLLVHAKHGFFMNWSGQQAGEGFEYNLLVMAIAIVLLIQGGGRGALDSVILHRATGIPPRTGETT
jgi:putative oxidoreductase